ncbi:hypothetical protein FGF76_24210 [Salmonella sp. gx-f4]|nr:hypothetical protein [Salmonella sp. gx-f4]
MTDGTSNSSDFVSALKEFYSQYVVTTGHGAFQVFQSFTYGEMVISFLLLAILFFMIFRFIYEVLR